MLYRPTSSIAIQFLRFIHHLIGDRCSRSFKGIDYPSNFLITDTKRPSAHRRVTLKPNFAVVTYCLCLFAVKQSNIYSVLTTDSVEMAGFEPATFALQRRCSPTELHPQIVLGLVGLTGFEPVTPVLSGLCSNQLSYKPAPRLNN